MKRTILITVVLFLALGLTAFITKRLSFQIVFDENERRMLRQIAKDCDSLPPNFRATIEKFIPNLLKGTVSTSLINRLKGNYNRECACTHLYIPPYGSFEHSFAFEAEFGQQKCLDILFQNSSYGHLGKTLREAVLDRFGKQLDDLNEEEVLAIWLVQKAGSHFGKMSNEELFLEVNKRKRSRSLY